MTNNFLINFHKKYFDESIPIYSKEVFYKILEEIEKLREGKKHDQQPR